MAETSESPRTAAASGIDKRMFSPPEVHDTNAKRQLVFKHGPNGSNATSPPPTTPHEYPRN
jgi:hypothetical protein